RRRPRRARTPRSALVVRGAPPAQPARFPIPLSIRACGFPAHGLPTVFVTWLRSLRVADGAHELMQALVVEPGARPAARLARPQVAAALLDEQALQPPHHVAVHGDEPRRRVPGAEVVAPSPKEQVQPPDDGLQLHPNLAPIGEGLDPLACP